MNNAKKYIVTRQAYEWSKPVKSLPMTEKQAVEAVLHYERLNYLNVDYYKITEENTK